MCDRMETFFLFMVWYARTCVVYLGSNRCACLHKLPTCNGHRRIMILGILNAGGPSPAPAAPVVRVVDSLPALAAPESAQLRFTLPDALNYRRYVYRRSGCDAFTVKKIATQVRKNGNAATHYYRKLFTLKDGTPLINFLDFSHVDCCKIIRSRACGLQFRMDKRASFYWKALVAVGLTNAQLREFLTSPITSVKFMPSSTSDARREDGLGSLLWPWTWSWIFEREDDTWIALEPDLGGREMNFQVAAPAGHPRRTGVVLTPRIFPVQYGGLEDEVWRRHLLEELSSGRFMPEIDCRPDGWCDNNPIAKAIEGWLLWEFEAARGNPYTQDLLQLQLVRNPIQIPSGASAILQPLDTLSLTQMPALAADSEEGPLQDVLDGQTGTQDFVADGGYTSSWATIDQWVQQSAQRQDSREWSWQGWQDQT